MGLIIMQNVKIFFSNVRFQLHICHIHMLQHIRKFVGKINAKRIDTSVDVGVVKIPKHLIKWLGCVTAEDLYITTGIYDALVKPRIITGYTNLGINDDTDAKILKILCSNYKWNEETQFGNTRGIEWSWHMGCSPIRFLSVKEDVIVWSKEDIRNVCDF